MNFFREYSARFAGFVSSLSAKCRTGVATKVDAILSPSIGACCYLLCAKVCHSVTEVRVSLFNHISVIW